MQEPLPAEPPNEQTAQIERLTDRIRMLEDQRTEFQNELRLIRRRAHLAEETLAAFGRATRTHLGEIEWAHEAISPSEEHASELLPVLFTSDMQCGEVVDPRHLDGMNAYNMDIFAERYTHLINRTCDLSFHHVGRADFPGIFYLRGGDAISGEIHLELAKTNDLNSVPAIRHLLRYEVSVRSIP